MTTKQKILTLLESNRTRNISGESIAKHLDISRNAVWKNINELKKVGYEIEAVSNKGYRISDACDILSVEGIRLFLSNKNTTDNIKVHTTLDSTNTTAKEAAIAGGKHGTVVIADYLSNAKGRYGRKFFTLPGHGIYMSIILHPDKFKFLNCTPTLITSYTALSVCEAIESITDKSPQIKWVNDVFIDSKKICGILTEAVTDFESGNMQWVVVGIGINFITPKAGFPEEIQNIAGSVFSHNRPTVTRNQLTAEVINRMLNFENYIDSKTLISEYKKRLMMLGKRVNVTHSNETFGAVAIDVDENGGLIVERVHGERIVLNSGEVSLGSR